MFASLCSEKAASGAATSVRRLGCRNRELTACAFRSLFASIPKPRRNDDTSTTRQLWTESKFEVAACPNAAIHLPAFTTKTLFTITIPLLPRKSQFDAAISMTRLQPAVRKRSVKYVRRSRDGFREAGGAHVSHEARSSSWSYNDRSGRTCLEQSAPRRAGGRSPTRDNESDDRQRSQPLHHAAVCR
jgi:hypothetical protein